MEDFVTYSQAVKLKDLGFNWEVNHYYENEILKEGFVDEDEDPDLNPNYPTSYGNYNFMKQTFSAPTLSEAQKWLRKVKNIIVNVLIDDNSIDPWSYELLSTIRDEDNDWVYLVPQWETNFWCSEPEEALSEGISKALELLKEESK